MTPRRSIRWNGLAFGIILGGASGQPVADQGDEIAPSHCLPQARDQPHLAFNSGHQSRNLRPAIWGANGQFCAAKILNRACRLGVNSRRTRPRPSVHALPLLPQKLT